MSNRSVKSGLALGAVMLCLAACDNGPSAVETRDRSLDAAPMAAADLNEATSVEPYADAPAAPKTLVTANRRETVDAKSARLFARNGTAFGARSAEDYLAKMQAFTRNPPSGSDTASRPNGDTLIYQASTNTFAVVARNGTPRTMFKPDDGPAYWAEQKARAPTFGRRSNSGGNAQ